MTAGFSKCCLSLSLFLFLFLVFSQLHGQANAVAFPSRKKQVYIVYMGASLSPHGTSRDDHAQLLSSLTTRRKNPVLHTYSSGFTGFAAQLSEKEAKSIAKRPGVVSVFPDADLQIHTTRSWDFLKLESGCTGTSHGTCSARADTIIGFLDTGIWPESKCFSDVDMGPIPSRWKGKCMEGKNFTSSSCNRKLIGARYYDSTDGTYTMGTARDEDGHGTHLASIAAGMPVAGASYYGLAKGTAEGGSPSSRIAMYRVCRAGGGCPGSAILKAFDDAIADGVDVLSVAMSFPGEPDFHHDPVSIGALHAVEKGIVVVCSAGNFGSAYTVGNVSPWIMTAAGTSIDRGLETNIVLGNKVVVKGGGINFSRLNKSPVYQLVDGSSAKRSNSNHTEDDARNCIPGSLDDGNIKGKIVLCASYAGEYESNDKYNALKKQGSVGMILINDQERYVPSKYGTSVIAAVSEEDGTAIQSYIKSNRDPRVTILPTVMVSDYKPAPVVGFFSSKGPIFGINTLLKPDIAAPGEAIIAAWPSNDMTEALPGRKPPHFDVLTGTSMSCAHVAALAAMVKSHHPKWSPSAIKSAIMTSAIQTNNLHAPITTHLGSKANPYDIGSGQINLSGSLQPGLVYETRAFDYFQFLCNFGFDTNLARNRTLTKFTCSRKTDLDFISNMNYPSLAIVNVRQNETKAVKRTVTNVGEKNSTYTAIVDAPDAVKVEVVPSKLQFTQKVKKLSFQVKFKLTVAESREDFFGSITWSNGKYHVRSPFVATSA